MSDRHYSEEKRKRERGRKRTEDEKGVGPLSLSVRLYVSDPRHDENAKTYSSGPSKRNERGKRPGKQPTLDLGGSRERC